MYISLKFSRKIKKRDIQKNRKIEKQKKEIYNMRIPLNLNNNSNKQ